MDPESWWIPGRNRSLCVAEAFSSGKQVLNPNPQGTCDRQRFDIGYASLFELDTSDRRLVERNTHRCKPGRQILLGNRRPLTQTDFSDG